MGTTRNGQFPVSLQQKDTARTENLGFIVACDSLHAKSLQSCPTLFNPMDCSPPGSSVHGVSRQEYWSGLSFPPPRIFPTQGSSPHLLHWQVDSLSLSRQGSPSCILAIMNSAAMNMKTHWLLKNTHCDDDDIITLTTDVSAIPTN